MPDSLPASTLTKFTTFGDLLRFLRRRAGITQVELSIAVGYSDPQISRLEQNLRLPDIPTLEARFVAPLCLEDEPRALARLLELAADVRREDAPAPGLCPYKGLDYFDEVDADLFVGREALTDKLATRVLSLASGDSATQGKFFAIVGASGCGKSSLVRAGLVPALRWNKASTTWLIQIITPTAHPLESLASALTRATGSIAATARLMDDLATEPRTLSMFIRREVKTSPGSYFLLVIDQFEELFALCRSEDERSAYINNLVNATDDEDSKIIIVINLRADFYGYCSGYLHLREALARHQEYIGAMSDEEMRRAIDEPAHRGRWEFEPGLVNVILHDVGHEPGALPLLSHALLETWHRRHGRTMTLSGYTSAGGVRGAIAETAEAVFTDQFSSEQQAIARRIFLRLTELGDETDAGDTRRQATIDELILKPEFAEATQVVLKALADARLVTTSENSVQVAHEALIREWPTLRGWLEENREGLRLHGQLTTATQEWLIADREPDILFRGARLAQAREWAVANAEDLNLQERAFLDASIASSEREIAEREAARERELEAAQKLAEAERKRADAEQERAEVQVETTRHLRIRSFFIASFGVLAVILAILAFLAWRQSASQAAMNLSLSLMSAAQQASQAGKGDLALSLAMEAIKINPQPSEDLITLREIALGSGTRAILNKHSASVQAVDIAPDEKTALSGSCAQLNPGGACQAGELILWDMGAMKEIRRWSAHHDWINKMAYSSDGQYIISSAQDGSLILWNMHGESIREPRDLPCKITDLAFVPNAASVLLAFNDGSMLQWDFQTDEYQPFILSSSPISALAIAANKPTLVTVHQDGSLRLWDLKTRQYLRTLTTHGSGINVVTISPDGRRIFFAGADPLEWSIHMIDAEDGRLLHEQPIGELPSDFVISSGGSNLLASCTVAVILFDFLNMNITYSFREFPDIVIASAINKQGDLGIAARSDGSLSVLNLGNREKFEAIKLDAGTLTAVAISPDGNYILLNDSAEAGCCQPALWDIDQERIVKTYSLPIEIIPPGAIKISPDGRYAAAAGASSGLPTFLLWDLETGELQCPPFEGYTTIEGQNIFGRAVAFSPDGQSLLAGSQILNGSFGELFLWDVESCKLVRQFDTTTDVSSIAFSSDGSRAITGQGFRGTATMWDVATGKEIELYTWTDYGAVLGVAFGPDDKTILGSGNADIYEWDVGSKDIIQRYTGLTMYPYTIALSQDGKYVLSGTMNGEVIVWDFVTGEKLNQINTHLSIYNVGFVPDSKVALAGTDQGVLIKWDFAEKPLSELLPWIAANRYVRELTEVEKQQYHLEP